ncbi:MAG: hypothetical protein KC800_02600 [Candidatus Eremiobacteraeota bacterium]|nr:hypothetical protein [Candidatus Eremiobacteraeota bacterium]
MNRFTKISILALTLLLFGNLLIVGAKTSLAQGMGTAISSAQTSDGSPACWIAVGNKIYYVEKDDSTILKVKASGAL